MNCVVSERPSVPIACASANNAQMDCFVQPVGSLVRLIGHAQMDFTARDAYALSKAIVNAIDPNERMSLPEASSAQADKKSGTLIFSRELLMHYQCPLCKGWWSIGDGRSYGGYFCPYCGAWLEVAR